MDFVFEHGWWLGALVLPFCLYLCPIQKQKRYFVHLGLFPKTPKYFDKEKLLVFVALSMMVLALAQPILYKQQPTFAQKGRDLVFALDGSGSMAQSGFDREEHSKSKFDVVKELFGDFIQKRHDDNIGVVLFGSYAMAMSGLTYDMHALGFLLRFLETGLVGESTAIGDAMMSALEVLSRGKAKQKVILLLSDGYQNSGVHSIQEAILQAQKNQVKIYTIGIGKGFDQKLLQAIAKDTGGAFFRAQDAKALQEVYAKLNTLEPSAVRSKGYLEKKMLFYLPLLVAFGILFYLISLKREKICSF